MPDGLQHDTIASLLFSRACWKRRCHDGPILSAFIECVGERQTVTENLSPELSACAPMSIGGLAYNDAAPLGLKPEDQSASPRHIGYLTGFIRDQHGDPVGGAQVALVSKSSISESRHSASGVLGIGFTKKVPPVPHSLAEYNPSKHVVVHGQANMVMSNADGSYSLPLSAQHRASSLRVAVKVYHEAYLGFTSDWFVPDHSTRRDVALSSLNLFRLSLLDADGLPVSGAVLKVNERHETYASGSRGGISFYADAAHLSGTISIGSYQETIALDTGNAQTFRLNFRRLAVSGVVVGTQGAPLDKAVVARGSHRTRTDASGRFSIVLPQSARRQRTAAGVQLSVSKYGYLAKRVIAKPGEELHVQLNGAKMGTGHVLDNVTMTPIRGAEIKAQSGEVITSNAQGGFDVPLTGHTEQLLVDADGFAPLLYTVQRYIEGTALPVDIGDIRLTPAGGLRGTIKSNNGLAIPEVTVSVDGVRKTRSDAMGHFVISDIAAGTRTIGFLQGGRMLLSDSGVSINAGQVIEREFYLQ